MADPKFEKKHKQVIIPFRCYVQGNDNQAIICYAPKSRAKRDVQTIQRVHSSKKAISADWAFFKCAQLKVNSTVNSAIFISSYLHQPANPVPQNLLVEPNEDHLNSATPDQTGISTSCHSNFTRDVAPNVPRSELQPATITVSSHFPSSASGADSMFQAQGIIVLNSHGTSNIPHMDFENESTGILLISENVEDSGMNIDDDFDSGGPMIVVWKNKDGELLPDSEVKKSVGGAINNTIS
ncbi:hypothetical protein QAD02_018404 [Eretmocerus hayati]|uniref:Uncharacterized protein n=1 Tax=Eretmocerus hayati TaxID=131215 RepID=A0ACC2PGY2_9HYME|nr:hypothetical protein QAD02_018404 [Eretmocerus hayati]